MTDYDEIIEVHANGAHASVLQQKGPSTDTLGGEDAAPDLLLDGK
jgi:hypothetical protein